MKIVHTADWHIGKSLNDYSLLEDQRYYFDKFIEKIKEIKPDALIVAGDLYDRSIPSSEAINLLNDILCKIVMENKIETFIVAGNHDSKQRLSFGSELLKKAGLHIVGNISKDIKKISYKDVNFHLIPYIEPHNIKQLYPDLTIKTHNEAMKIYSKNMIDELDTNKINILVSHGLFGYGVNSDVSVGGGEMIDASIFEDFDYVALGHLHSHRTAGSKKMIFSGSPIKYSIDEVNQNKSFTVIDITTKDNVEFSTISIKPLRDIKILEGSFEYLCNRDNFNNLDDYVFMNITDDKIILNAMSRLKSVFKNTIGLKYINLNSNVDDEFIKEKSEVAKLSEFDLFENFYHDVTEKNLDDSSKEYIKETLKAVKGDKNDTD